MILSIVIPYYNVQDWIKECLQSVINSVGFKESVEIILVNDGSRDNSSSIAEELANANPSLILNLKKPNGGLSDARNFGLSHAKGDYVWFVDSDDFIEPISVSVILEAIRKSNSNVDMINFKYRTTNGSKAYFLNNVENYTILRGIDLLYRNPVSCAQFYIYSNGYLKKQNLKFKKGLYHEDVHFNYYALLNAEKVLFLNEFLYNYRIREGSIMQSNWFKHLSDIISIIIEIQEKSITYTDPDKKKATNIFLRHQCKAINYYYRRLNKEEKKMFNLFYLITIYWKTSTIFQIHYIISLFYHRIIHNVSL